MGRRRKKCENKSQKTKKGTVRFGKVGNGRNEKWWWNEWIISLIFLESAKHGKVMMCDLEVALTWWLRWGQFFVDQNYETHGGVLFFYFALVAFTLSRRFFDLFSFMVCLKIYGGAEPKNKFMVEQYWSSFYFLDSTEKIK